MATLGTVPARTPSTQGGISYAWADGRHLVFVYNLAVGDQQQNVWNLYSWPLSGGPLAVIAHNPVSSARQPLGGGWIHPYVDGNAIYWIQAAHIPAQYRNLLGGSALMQYSYTTGHTRVLYQGLTESFVLYGHKLLYTALPHTMTSKRDKWGKPPEIMRAIDVRTGTPTSVPPGITAASDAASFIVTNGDIIVWDTGDSGLRAWRASWGRSVDIFPPLDNRPKSLDQFGTPATPRLWGPYLMWHDRQTYLLDLRTDSFTALTKNHSTAELSGSLLAIWEYSHPSPPAPGQLLHGSQYALNLTNLPRLPMCT